MKPVFVFSLPRSGSTLLQRVLASHCEIATASEPWILLPFIYSLKENKSFSDYGHYVCSRAINDFCKELPNGKADYLEEIRGLSLRLYEKAAKNDVEYFLDKTPRYHLISEEIISMFQDGKFILLFRNPLAIVSSMMSTWDNGKWNLHFLYVDLFDGMEKILEVQSKFPDRVLHVQYENLIMQPEIECERICEYLNIDYNSKMIEDFFNVKLKGQYGDPTGVEDYQTLSEAPLIKWKENMGSPIRKLWSRSYLKWIGQERLNTMGYDLQVLLDELNEVPTTYETFFSDAVRFAYGWVYCNFEFKLLSNKISYLMKGMKKGANT